MSNPLVRSNRNNALNDALKPEKTMRLNKTEVETVTFDTNLKISNHSRNKLQSMANLGYATNQKNAVDIAIDAYMESLTFEERKELELQIKTLETKDARLYASKQKK